MILFVCFVFSDGPRTNEAIVLYDNPEAAIYAKYEIINDCKCILNHMYYIKITETNCMDWNIQWGSAS